MEGMNRAEHRMANFLIGVSPNFMPFTIDRIYGYLGALAAATVVFYRESNFFWVDPQYNYIDRSITKTKDGCELLNKTVVKISTFVSSRSYDK